MLVGVPEMLNPPVRGSGYFDPTFIAKLTVLDVMSLLNRNPATLPKVLEMSFDVLPIIIHLLGTS
jgi:hypothetical protein